MTETFWDFSPVAVPVWRRRVSMGLRAFVLSTVVGLFVVSCGGAVLPPKPTDDPIAGAFVIKGGGGALDSGKALTTPFAQNHPPGVWDGLDHLRPHARAKLAIDSSVDIEVFQIDETLKAIASFKDAIGMMTMNAQTFSSADAKLVTIDNVAATRENLANGTYPIRRPLYFVSNPDGTKLKPAIKSFIDWVKGPDGQKVIASL